MSAYRGRVRVGWGDDLMAAGRARALRADAGPPVAIVNRQGVRAWSELWRNNPDIAQPEYDGEVRELIDGSGNRQYIVAKDARQWTWRDFKPTPARLVFPRGELEYAEHVTPLGAVLIEPTLKPKASPNKQWPVQYWRELVMAHPSVDWVQVGTRRVTRVHPRVHYITTPSFRHACAVLARCRAAVLHEGGLHHAAAAVGVRAVVIYGGFITPAQTGYDLHTNLVASGPQTPCGMRVNCQHCVRAMSAIKPAHVWEALNKII